MWRVRSGGSGASYGSSWGAQGRHRAPGCAPVVTSEGALLVSVPQRFLSPLIRPILAGQMRERKASEQILVAFTSTLGYLSSPLRNPPLRISVSSKRNANPPPRPPRSKCLALQRLEEIVAAIKPASAVSKLHQSCHCGVSRTGELMQAEKSAETFFNDICFYCDLQAGGGVFTVEPAAQAAGTNNPECVQNLSTTKVNPGCRPRLFSPLVPFCF